MMVKCKCIRGIIFDCGATFEADKRYMCEIEDEEWITVLDSNNKEARLMKEGTFKSEFRLYR